MEGCKRDMDENALIHTLPYEVMRELSRILDVDDAWVDLASRMPNITIQDVDGCRQFSSLSRGSPSEYLLRIWASKGYSILSLYNLFAITRMNLVPECYHYLEECGTPEGGSKLSPSHQQQQTLEEQVSIKQNNLRWHNTSTAPTGSSQKTSGVSSDNKATLSSTTNVSDPVWSAIQNTPTVPYGDLLVATSNFSDENIIGKGGYGVVYAGEWKHIKIAVKRFMAYGSRGAQIQRERLRQSLQELKTLAKFRHDNILPLYAFSIEGPEPCLVYQFMSNGSLEDRLLCRRGTAPLTWLQKKEITEGAARGLHFLHSIGSVPIIHGDVKSANILLDRHFEPKLGDFGLSRDGLVEAGVDEKSPLIASHVKGTLAYLPPEFITNKILSTKLDVYSFGVVLLEICTGMRAYVDSRAPPNLVDYCTTRRSMRKNATGVPHPSWIVTLIDKRTPAIGNQGFVSAWCEGTMLLGLQCTDKDRFERPSFPEIVDSLSLLPSISG